MEGQETSDPTASASSPSEPARNITYEEICRGIEALCDQIAASPDGWLPDAIVAVVRGGLIPATHICHYFERPIHFICNGVLLDKLDGYKRILIVDEINDTGTALQRIRDRVFNRHPNHHLDVRYAVLYTRHTAHFIADYFLDFDPFFIDNSAWQNFPWEQSLGEQS